MYPPTRHGLRARLQRGASSFHAEKPPTLLTCEALRARAAELRRKLQEERQAQVRLPLTSERAAHQRRWSQEAAQQETASVEDEAAELSARSDRLSQQYTASYCKVASLRDEVGLRFFALVKSQSSEGATAAAGRRPAATGKQRDEAQSVLKPQTPARWRPTFLCFSASYTRSAGLSERRASVVSSRTGFVVGARRQQDKIDVASLRREAGLAS